MHSPHAAGRQDTDSEARLLRQQEEVVSLCQRAVDEIVYGSEVGTPRGTSKTANNAAAGLKALAPKAASHTSALPIEYNNLSAHGKRHIYSESRLKEEFPPYALGNMPPPPPPPAPPALVAPLEGEARPASAASIVTMPVPSLNHLRSSISKQTGGSQARVTAAFAKRDQSRQGKLAPADFAAAVRDLGVPLSVRNMHGITGANMDLSSDTIDYLAFVNSLEPRLAEAASEVAAAPAAAAQPATSKLDTRRLFGSHSSAARSHSVQQALCGGVAGGGSEGSGEEMTAPPRLQEHAAFASAAGVGAERIYGPEGEPFCTRRHYGNANHAASSEEAIFTSEVST